MVVERLFAAIALVSVPLSVANAQQPPRPQPTRPPAAQQPAAPQTGLAGEWLVADKVAKIRIESCTGKVWGVIAWEKQAGKDSNNPDPALRTRPFLGSPIVMGMTPKDANTAEGDIYNAQDGKTYQATLSLKSPDVLQVRGCVLGFLCGGEEWARARPGEPAGGVTLPPGSICSRVAGRPGPSH